MQDEKRIQPFRIYKPVKNGGGAASYWRLSVEKKCVWLEVSGQIGSMHDNKANFDWENKLRFKLGIADLGEILSVLTGIKEGVGNRRDDNIFSGLFHQTIKGNSSLALVTRNNGYYMKLSVKNKENGEINSHAHNITFGEGHILKILIESGLSLIYNWTKEGANYENNANEL